MKKIFFLMGSLIFLTSNIVLASDGIFQKPTEWNYIDEQYDDGSVKKCRYGDPCDGIGGSTPYHTGIDYQQDAGSDYVYAAAEGEVVRIQSYNQEIADGIFEDHRMGNVLVLKHYCVNDSDCPPNGKVYTLYAHLQSFDADLSIGDWVHKGDVIGVIGGSGNDNLNLWPQHLHFEIKRAPVLYEASSEEMCMRTVESWRTFYSWYSYEEVCYGYSPQNDPGVCGYFNPDNFIGNVVAKDLSGIYPSFPVDYMDGMNGEYGIVGFGYSSLPTETPNPNLPNFITTKSWLSNQSDGEDEDYTYYPDNQAFACSKTKNVGEADSPSDIKVMFLLSDGYKEDSHNEWQQVGDLQNIRDYNMEVGESQTECTEFHVPTTPGIYNVVSCPDRIAEQYNEDGEVLEEHESDNCATEAVFSVIERPDPSQNNAWLVPIINSLLQ